MISQQFETLDSNGIDLQKMGYPTYDNYIEMRETVTEYTGGSLLMTSWNWNKDDITPGHAAGVCIAET